MGACILCGKSAGLFYSLHKGCYATYEDANQYIVDCLSRELSVTPTQALADKINQHITQCQFLVEAQKRTLNRALEAFATEHIHVTQTEAARIHAWQQLLDVLEPNQALFINPNFLQQQNNLYALQQINNGCLPESNCHPANFSIALREQETLWWCFEKSEIAQDSPQDANRQWSIMTQLLTSTLPQRRKREQAKIVQGDGKLLVTNQRLLLEASEHDEGLELADIFSVTPVKNGVRMQSRRAAAVAQTYVCEDAALLFGFIRYARGHVVGKAVAAKG